VRFNDELRVMAGRVVAVSRHTAKSHTAPGHGWAAP